MSTMTFEVELPEWARWVAQDKRGQWYAYSEEPSIYGSEWCQGECRLALLAHGVPSKNWRLELYRVTQ